MVSHMQRRHCHVSGCVAAALQRVLDTEERVVSSNPDCICSSTGPAGVRDFGGRNHLRRQSLSNQYLCRHLV